MKNRFKRIGVLLLMVVLLCGLLAMPAAAVSNTFTEGEYVSWIVASEGSEVVDFWVDTSLLPPGTSLTSNYDIIVLSGTPTTPGRYDFYVDAYYSTPDGTSNVGYSVTVTIEAVPAPTPVQAASGSNTVSDTPSSPAPDPDPLPTNVPDIVITKHPTGETVTAGGSALFIARANNASQIIWFVEDPNGNIYSASEAPNHTSASLHVSGLGTESLSLSNIPKSMNGWKVFCTFEGLDGTGSATTNSARITVTDPATATPSSTQTPAPTPDKAPETPAPTEAREAAGKTVIGDKNGGAEINDTAQETEEPEPTETPASEKPQETGGKKGQPDSGKATGSAGSQGLMIALIVVGVLLLAAVVILAVLLVRKNRNR